MDIADKAAQCEAALLNDALARQAAKQHGGQSYSYCEDCGAPIPPARQQAAPGCTRCILCQTYAEKGWP
ncbi:TraR/DksA family transcriptional regulator [Paralysiella testudinis]|uniref:TraR/DksA family transcriptional regulator n=1 Tax=Paralysiella testudinis TaxID=2809020 RepID=A0A892ZML2_9NEIS|nr:TraR/DksA family transcriptional regulator [Paralysiella testudinis]QRQ81103.1 TraR/DksA family transcriptional regulator [Paralysiella testudinis]QRQ82099.1 TraR/DksA family transcriptional regulator [Paralysiella testudinis]